MKQAFKPKRILWVDLEMTGLDSVKDRILEVAAIVTDWDFKELANFQSAVQVDDGVISERMVGSFWDEFPEVKQQLVTQSKQAKSSAEVGRELERFTAEHFDPESKILLAGNSVHQDRRFIEVEWPELDGRLHYRMLDVSAWKVVIEGKYKRKFAKPETHRALEDIRGSIAELQYYLSKGRF